MIKKLFTEDFTYWWIVSLATLLMFDLFWMGQTTFRPMSYFTFYPVLLLGAFFLTLPSLFAQKGIIQTIWLLFFDAVFIANLMYCRTYYNAIPLQSYSLVGNLSDFSASVIDSYKWYFTFLPLLSIVAFLLFLFRRQRQQKIPSPLVYLLYITVLGFITWVSDAWRGGIIKRMDMMSEYAYLSSSIVPIYSLAGFLVHDYYKTSEKLTPEEKQQVFVWLDDHINATNNYWNDTLYHERKIPKNLVVILCESFESWVLGKTVEGIEITPNLNRLISDSSTFYAPKVVTQVGSGRSIEGQLLITTGLMPMFNKVYAYDSAENEYFSLPKAIKEKGGKAFLLTPDKPYVWNQAMVAPAFGYDSLIHASDFVINETTGRTKRLSDGSLMKQIVGKLKNGELWFEGERAMIMIVTNSGHNPFNLPQHLRTVKFNGSYPDILKDYMVTAHYTDSSLQYFLDYLKSRSDWDETMVVITGDHEGLASDRKAAINNPESAKFVDSLQHTPLIVLNSPVVGKFDYELGQVDLYSTILDLMGLNKYKWRGLGYSVLDPNHPKVAFGSSGALVGENEYLTGEAIKELKDARKTSDLIIKFNLLRDYLEETRKD